MGRRREEEGMRGRGGGGRRNGRGGRKGREKKKEWKGGRGGKGRARCLQNHPHQADPLEERGKGRETGKG